MMFPRVFLLVCTMLWFAPVRAQEPSPSHPLVESGLAHELDLSQTVDGITVTLDWAYADTEGFTLHVTVADVPEAMQAVIQNGLAIDAKLRDTAGYEFSFQGGGLGAVADDGALAGIVTYYSQAILKDANTGEWQVDNDYFKHQYESLPEELPLQFEVSLTDPGSRFAPVPDATGKIPPTPEPTFEPIGPFVFDFAVPLPAPVELEPHQAVDVGDLSMTLEALTITPAHADAQVCIQLPDPGDWQPQASITINGVEGLYAGSGMVDMAQIQNTERRCFNLRFDVMHSGQPESIVFSVDAIEKSMLEGQSDWLRIQDVLATHGIEITVKAQDHGISVDTSHLPDGVTLQEAMNMARDELGDRIVGPWTFEVT